MHACQATMPAGADPAAEFRERFVRLLGKAPEAFKAYGFAQCLPATWACAGVEVEAGERATAMAASPVQGVQLWMRVGAEGSGIHGARGTHSIVAPRAGALEVAVQVPPPPGDGKGATPPAAAIVVVIVWRESALRGLRRLAGAGDVHGLVREEINRLCNPAEGRAPGGGRT